MSDNRKIQDHISMYGWWNTAGMGLKSVIHRAFGFSWQRFILFEQDISKDQDFGYDFSKYDLRRIQIADFENDLWEPAFLTEEKRVLYEKRFSNPKDECLGIFIDNELACTGWNHYDELLIYGQFSIRTEKKSTYMYDAFCIPKYRRRGLQKIINAYRKYVATQKGVTSIYVAVATYNRPALKNQRKGGFKEIKRFTVIEKGDKIYCPLKSI